MGLGLRLHRRRIGCCPARCQLACVYGALDGASPTTTGTLYTGCRRGPISERWVRLSSVRRSRRVGAVTFAWAGVSYQALGTRSFALCPLCFAATRSWRRRRCVRDTVSVQPRLGLIRPLRPFTSRSTSTLRAAIGHVTSPRAAMHSKSSCHSTPSDNQPRMHLSITPSSPSHGRTSHLPRQGFPSPHLTPTNSGSHFSGDISAGPAHSRNRPSACVATDAPKFRVPLSALQRNRVGISIRSRPRDGR
jgi:hypothetical protein